MYCRPVCSGDRAAAVAPERRGDYHGGAGLEPGRPFLVPDEGGHGVPSHLPLHERHSALGAYFLFFFFLAMVEIVAVSSATISGRTLVVTLPSSSSL